ncbi:MAG TPA: redoxin domain-containing protein [Pyrinomonadaceae bacterium]|nr:redoxin domain-containing protein [Pyrinomonadaceae bacterium]
MRLKEAGGNLVAISVENPDNSLNVAKKNELNFTVLSDPDLIVARKFGIVYQMPKETAELYKTRGLISLNIMRWKRLNCRCQQLTSSTGKAKSFTHILNPITKNAPNRKRLSKHF